MLNIGASYSTLSSAELLERVVSQYCVDSAISCEFWQRGINDTYIVKSKDKKYILRIYRNGWRTLPQINFEVDALNFLYEKGAKVSYPTKRLDGEYVTALNTPEGVRYALITSFAEGKELSFDDVDNSYFYGVNVAEIHSLSEGFSSKHSRFELDYNHLLSEPLEYIKPFLAHRPKCWIFMEKFGALLMEIIKNTDDESVDYGLCHGDFHGGNAHVSSKILTHYDFDCCGNGLRAYDIAVFRWDARLAGKERERWEAFVRGYETKRKISDVTLKLTIAFVAIRDIWLMGLHMGNATDFGRDWLDDDYIDRRIKFLKAIEEEHFT